MNPQNLTQTSVKQFRAFMKFIADNNLWDELEQRLHLRGYHDVVVSSEPINIIRDVLREKISANQFPEQSKSGAKVIIDCACGVGNPGPPVKPVTPPSHGGGGDGGTGDGGSHG